MAVKACRANAATEPCRRATLIIRSDRAVRCRAFLDAGTVLADSHLEEATLAPRPRLLPFLRRLADSTVVVIAAQSDRLPPEKLPERLGV